jgi:hypothetical protein
MGQEVVQSPKHNHISRVMMTTTFRPSSIPLYHRILPFLLLHQPSYLASSNRLYIGDARLAVPVQRLVVDMRASGVGDNERSLLARPLVAPARGPGKTVNDDAHARRVWAETISVLDLELDIWVDALLLRPQRIEGNGFAGLLAEALLVDEGDVRPGVVGSGEEIGFLGAEPVRAAK